MPFSWLSLTTFHYFGLASHADVLRRLGGIDDESMINNLRKKAMPYPPPEKKLR